MVTLIPDPAFAETVDVRTARDVKLPPMPSFELLVIILLVRQRLPPWPSKAAPFWPPP